jgi:hypothetical protein
MALVDETIPRGNSRRDAPVKCSACGRTVRRKSRQQRYCSDRCRVYAQRENKDAPKLDSETLERIRHLEIGALVEAVT